jgi:hypothetical protein
MTVRRRSQTSVSMIVGGLLSLAARLSGLRPGDDEPDGWDAAFQ